MKLATPSQAQIDLLLAQGVSPTAMIRPSLFMTCGGERAEDGRFD